ncbi:MAG TPA: hypothetical protein VKT18_02665 [Acidimicrobiales bacterium]|jgi:hypothetical protein|nr:hypothetical protein [Acidimicrobiales bacterium]
MPDHEYLVLSKPPEGVGADEYNAWYDRHMREILELPGFVSAQRSALTLRGHRGEALPYEYLVRYGIDGDLDETLAGLRRAVDAGELHFPEWFPKIRTAGFHAVPVTDVVREVPA